MYLFFRAASRVNDKVKRKLKKAKLDDKVEDEEGTQCQEWIIFLFFLFDGGGGVGKVLCKEVKKKKYEGRVYGGK